MENSNLSSDVNFLFEIGNIRYIDRMWRRFYSKDFANLADHHFRVFWIAMIIAKHENAEDVEKIAKMALLHDIAESRTGDADYLASQYVERNEELGIKDMLAHTIIEKEFLALWQEYEDKQSLEAKIVKDADSLDVDFELAEQASHGNTLRQEWADNRKFVLEHKLYTRTAKQMAAELARANPHAWHLEGRNRRNSGEWQIPPTT